MNNVKTLRSSPTHQAVFDTFLGVLGTLIRTCDLEKGILEQLWTFLGLTLGGPLGSKSFENGWNDAVRRRLVGLWAIILDRLRQNGQLEDVELPGPIVAHTLNTLLLVLEDSDTEQDTKTICLDFLNSFVKDYLQPEDKVPLYLPGIVSTLAKVILGNQKSGRVVVAALQPLSNAIQASLNETRCEALDLYDAPAPDSMPQATSLESIFANNTPAQALTESSSKQGPFGGPSGTRGVDMEVDDDKTAATGSNEPGTSRAWLKATASQLQRAILSILPVLRYHQNAEVRKALAQFSYAQLDLAFRSLLPSTSKLLLEELLVCSRDTWEQVSATASVDLQRLLKPARVAHSSETTCVQLVSDIASEAITSLPHSIFQNGLAHEETLQRQLNLIIASSEHCNALDARQLKIERWSLNLVRAVEFAPIASGSSRGPRDETSPWTRSGPSSLLLMDHVDQPSGHLIEAVQEGQVNRGERRLPPFPPLKLANVAPGLTTTLLQDALKSLHRLSGSSEILEHFLGIAGYADTGLPVGGTSTVASALWVVQQILEGLAEDKKKEHVESCKQTVAEIPGLALSWLNRDDLEEMEDTIRPAESGDRFDGREVQTEADDIQAAEIQSGSLTLSGLLDEDANRRAMSKPSVKARRTTYELQIHCLCLRLIAGSAKLLRKDFQKHMLHVLYPLLRALCPSSETRVGILQAHAYCALHHISSYMGYDTPSRMLVDNVDYILNSISAHLRGTTTLSSGALDPLAPSVLVSVIELAGEDILPYLGDAVDEIFDALDRWHAYDLLVSELLRVLDRLVNVCSVDEAASTGHSTTQGRAIVEVQKMQPNPKKDLSTFEEWFKTRHDDRLRYKSETRHTLPSKVDSLPDQNPKAPFKTLVENNGNEVDEEEEGDMPADQPEGEEKQPALSKSQALVLAILRKSLYFLSHSSAFLRARVLALITSSIPVLADRTSDFLPEIHRFWPYILARLDDGFERSPAFVLLEVMRLLIALMRYRGDFMNRRILKDVLPRLRGLVQRHHFQPTSKNQFTNEYRTLRAILELVTVALRDVPGVSGQDLWTISVLFRPFLSSWVDPELRKEAAALYEALSQLDPDLVWLVLSSSLGLVQDLSVLVLPAWQPDEPEVSKLISAI